MNADKIDESAAAVCHHSLADTSQVNVEAL